MASFSASPAWDIRLDHYPEHLCERRISVISAAIVAACPATTALRWLHALEEVRLIIRQADAEDRRLTF